MNQVAEFFVKLFDSSDWPPRWHCGQWTAFHGWLYIISDLLIWSAYFSIPIFILRFISKKQDIRFVRLYFLFAAFILACGATHLFDAIAFWVPLYRLNALIRFITAVISWVTVFYLVKYLPVIFSLKPQNILEAEITQRKKAEDKFRGLLEAAPDGMIIANEKGEIVLINRQTEKLFVYAKEELIGKPVEVLIPVDFRNKHVSHRTQYMEAPKVRSMGAGLELYAVKKDGTQFPVEISLSPLITEEGTLISASVRDITDRKRSEEKLKKAKKDFQLLVSSVKDYAIFMLDKNGCVASWNTGAEHIKGYTAEEIIGQPLDVFYTEDEKAMGEPQKNLQRTLQLGHYETEGLRMRKDGTTFFANIVFTSLVDEEGKLYGYAKVTKDITEERKNEEALKKSNEEMEAFSYSVSHDLRAPLRGIIGFANILEEDFASKLDGEAKRITRVIKNNAIKMGRLIDDLLAFSRLGRQDILKTNIDSDKMVGDIIADYDINANNKKIKWIIHSLPNSKADINTLQQVWVNLISNAVKYSQNADNPTIEVGSIKESHSITFFVKDNGVGFDEKYKAKLFKVFQRLHTNEEFEGTGIGLAIVEKIISKHSGNVWAEAELNKGAVFYFSIPVDNDQKT